MDTILDRGWQYRRQFGTATGISDRNRGIRHLDRVCFGRTKCARAETSIYSFYARQHSLAFASLLVPIIAIGTKSKDEGGSASCDDLGQELRACPRGSSAALCALYHYDCTEKFNSALNLFDQQLSSMFLIRHESPGNFKSFFSSFLQPTFQCGKHKCHRLRR